MTEDNHSKEYLVSIMFSHYDRNNNGNLEREELEQVILTLDTFFCTVFLGSTVLARKFIRDVQFSRNVRIFFLLHDTDIHKNNNIIN